MDITPRFFFYGYASALGGQIVRPKAFDIDPECASALTPAGGVSRAEIGGKSFGGGMVTFGRALTWAEGRYESVQQAIAITHNKIAPRDVPTRTSTTVEIERLSVGQQGFPMFRVEGLRAVMNAESPKESDEPPISLNPETTFKGVSLDGFGLRIRLNQELFGNFTTRSKLVGALDDPKFVARHAGSLLLPVPELGAKAAKARRTSRRRAALQQPRPPVGSKDAIYATIVSSLAWTNKPHPRATIDGHVLSVKNLGKIYFGEMLVSYASRRLTMLRFEFGSPFGGFASSGSVGQNGSWAP